MKIEKKISYLTENKMPNVFLTVEKHQNLKYNFIIKLMIND
jgi:hypothetical protein